MGEHKKLQCAMVETLTLAVLNKEKHQGGGITSHANT
jgi:hypothetical protein